MNKNAYFILAMVWPKKKKPTLNSEEHLITKLSRKWAPVSSLTPTFLIDNAGHRADEFQMYWRKARSKADKKMQQNIQIPFGYTIKHLRPKVQMILWK